MSLDKFSDNQLQAELDRRKYQRAINKYQDDLDKWKAKGKTCKHGCLIESLCNCNWPMYDCSHHCSDCRCM